jgi:hypothetical protein
MSLTTMYGVTLTVEAALSAATGSYGAWGTGLWNTATWGPDEVFQDISAYVRSVSTTRGFERNVQAWQAGTATLELLNFDGRFSPSNLTGPYVTAGVTGVRPWRPIRIRAAYNGVTYDVYRGYALAWQETYAEAFPGGGGAYVTVPCVDELGALARFDGLAQLAVGAGETSGVRMHRVLDNAGHSGTRSIDPGNVTVQATTLAQNAVTELKLTADSEGGALYIGKDGAVVFERNYALIENARSNTIQATFGDGAGELPYSDVALTYDGDLMANIAAFARVGGTAQTSTNETSRALYRDKRYSRSDLICQTDLQVANLADFYVQAYGQPEQRITTIEVKPRNSPALLFPQVLGREVRDLIRAVRRPPGGYTITRDCHIAGISHQISKDDWVTSFDLWSASVYQGVGRWDVATWDTSTWFY